MINLRDPEALNRELEKVVINFFDYHQKMDEMRNFYKKSCFYPWQSGQPKARDLPDANLLQLFADKLIEYTSPFPKIKVVTPGPQSEQRQFASLREKACYAVWRKSNGALLQQRFAYDAAIRSVAVAETVVDLKKRCVYIRRHAPQKCFWQLSNDSGELRVIAFWTVSAVTKDEAWSRYSVKPTADVMANVTNRESRFSHVDGRDWFTQVIRWDNKTRVHWIGNKLVEEPHNHLMGEIPIDLCMPIFDGDDDNHRAAFYLEPLLPAQAELNDVVRRRSRIVHRMSSPVVWARGLMNKKFDDFEEDLANGGGLLGVAKDGEVGLLQVPDTGMLKEHEQALVLHMMRLAGFGSAAFGEPVGANTSGDALSMYFNPTARKIKNQFIAWQTFYESINAKVLRAFETFGLPNEQFDLSGYAPSGTVLSYRDEKTGQMYNQRTTGNFSIMFTPEMVQRDYNTCVEFPEPTPKNEIEEKRLVKEAVSDKFLSRTSAYERWGIDSPEDELEMLKAEQLEPSLNPDGVAALISAQNAGTPAAGNPVLPPARQPAALPEGVANGT